MATCKGCGKKIIWIGKSLYGDIIVDVISFGPPEGHQQFRSDVNGATAYLIGRGAKFETIEQ